MKIIYRLITLALIAAGLFVMFSSSMMGGGLSGFIGLPLLLAGLFVGLWQVGRQHGDNA